MDAILTSEVRARRDAATLVVLGLLGFFVPALAARFARPAVLNFGPNDAEYVRGFRPDWEQDERARFHWTTPAAAITLPIGVRGPDLKLHLRFRRHFVEPANVSLTVEGGSAGAFEARDDPRTGYRTVELPLPLLRGRQPLVIGVDAPSANPRPLGIALDWLEIERSGGEGEFLLGLATRYSVLIVVALAFLGPRLAGAPWLAALAHALATFGAATLGFFWDIIAAERIVRLGLVPYVGVLLLALGLARLRPAREFFGLSTRDLAGALVIVTMTALAVRLALLLHPQFYYPDVRIHARFAWQLLHDGPATFLRDFTANQYRHSLGLQLVNEHWYAFPYPPLFYFVAWPLLRFANYAPEASVAILAAVANSLEAFAVFAIARRLGAGAATALASAAAMPLLPIFLARLTLAYFPALFGHALDSLVILYLLTHLRNLARPRVVATLAAWVAVALLAYTQSLLNLGLLLPLFLIAQIAFDRSPGAWRRHAGLAVAGALGVLLAFAVFYGRYLPIVVEMRHGVPMPEERVLLEKNAGNAASGGAVEARPEEDDPYAGPDLDLLRGFRKAGRRLYIFYGVFAPLCVAGVLLVARLGGPTEARFVMVWASVYVLLNLASGGLPGPNLVRYNKDMEIVAPLCCIALGTLAVALWQRGRAGRLAAVIVAGGFLVFGAWRAASYLAERFVFER